MRRVQFAGWAVLLLATCSTTMSPEDEAALRWAREVRILRPEQVGDRRYDVLAALEERVRIGAMGEEDAVREAEWNLRLRAAKLDADAVVVEFCGRATDRRDPATAALPTVICQGYAIRWE